MVAVTFESALAECFPHVSSTFSLIGRMIHTVAAERVLIRHICSLFQQSRRLSSSWLDNGTEFCLTFFSFLWTPEIPFYGRNARLLQTILSTSGWVWATLLLQKYLVLLPWRLGYLFSVFPACMFAYFPYYWVSSLYACNDWIWTTNVNCYVRQKWQTLFVRFSAWFKSCIC